MKVISFKELIKNAEFTVGDINSMRPGDTLAFTVKKTGAKAKFLIRRIDKTGVHGDIIEDTIPSVFKPS